MEAIKSFNLGKPKPKVVWMRKKQLVQSYVFYRDADEKIAELQAKGWTITEQPKSLFS
jgi:hypothetical protein